MHQETRLWQKVINLVCTNVRKMNLRGRIWLQNFITQLRIADGIKKPLRINCDNKAAELYSKNNRSSSKSKHIDIKFLVVKERVQSFQVSIEHISTNSMIADPLTKGLPLKVYHEHVTHMGVVHIDDVLV